VAIVTTLLESSRPPPPADAVVIAVGEEGLEGEGVTAVSVVPI